MNLFVEKCVSGRWNQNCYIASDDSGEALIIDPGSDVGVIAAAVRRNCLCPLAILNTHGHHDHVRAIAGLMDLFQVPFYMNGADLDILRHAVVYNFLFESSGSGTVPKITHDLRKFPPGVKIGNMSLQWIATPGHTPGSACFHMGQHLFTGDTLLPDGAGRTDLPGGSPGAMVASLRKLTSLPPDTQVHPGHGERMALAAGLSLVSLAKGESYEGQD